MRIDWVRLENFHGFKDQTIPLNESFTVLVGDNRSGKTAVLDGIAVALTELTANEQVTQSAITQLVTT
jgi:predicted ATP-binding protein involved in virulence